MKLEISEELIARQSREAQEIIRALLARIHELEAQLGKGPQNSSLPPSTQHPHAKTPKAKRKKGRRRGGRPGHRKHQRDIQSLIDDPDNQVKRLGHDLMRQVKRMFQHWKRYKSGAIQWQTFRTYMRPIREEVNALLLRGAFSGNPRLVGMCNELHDHRQWLWTFVDHEGIEPTNNTAERALRPAVIYRKLSFGTQSASGSRFIERMLTIGEICRLQGRSLFGYLTMAVQAHFAGQPPPSLLPGA